MSNVIENKKILITGGTGFIGSHLIKKIADNNEIIVLDNTSIEQSPLHKMNIHNHKNITVMNLSITKQEELNKLGKDFDYIIHLAAILGVQKVIEMPLTTMHVNGIGTNNILDLALRQKDLTKFMFFSTSEIYGQQSSRITENDPAIIPTEGIRWNYSCSKIFGEYLTKAAAVQGNLPFTIIRPFNVYGTYRYGTNAMTSLIFNALNNLPLSITGDGQQTRAWCFIDDFIGGIIAALTNDNAIGQAFNIGNDREIISMKDLAYKIKLISASVSEVILSEERVEDVYERSPNIKKARDLLNYNPQISLEEGITKTIQWHRQEYKLDKLGLAA